MKPIAKLVVCLVPRRKTCLERWRIAGAQELSAGSDHPEKRKRTVKDIAALLLIAPLAISHAQMSPTREDSLASIPNSGQRAAALRSFARTSDPEALLAIMRVARTIPNSTDKSRLLETLAPRYLGGDSTLSRS